MNRGRWRSALASSMLVMLAALSCFVFGSKLANAATVSLYNLQLDGGWDTTSNTKWVAQSFTTSSNPATFNSVAIWLRNNTGSGTTFSIDLYTDGGGQPGTLVTNVTTGSSIGAWGDGQITFTTTQLLQPATTYFVVLRGVAGSSLGWKYNAATPATVVSPAPTFTQRLVSTNSGSTWSSAGASYYNMTVQAGPIPLAPTVASVAAGVRALDVVATLGADGGSATTDVEYSLDGGASWASTGQSTGTFTISGLTPGTSYPVTVRAVNANGNSAASNSVSGTPADLPGAPTGVAAVAGDASATVSWTAPASDGGSAITGYTVTGTPGGSCTTATTSCSVTGLTNDTEYTFTVTATTALGTGPASSASAAVRPVGPTPTPAPTPTPTTSPTPKPSPSPTKTSASPTPTSPSPTPTPSTQSPTATPSPTETVSPTSTPAPSPTPSPTAAPAPSPTATTALDGNIFTDNAPFGPVINLSVDLAIGESSAGRSAVVSATGLAPSSTVTVTVFSTPQVVGTGTADASGAAAVSASVPANLEPGVHTIMATGTSPDGAPIQSIGAFEIADSLNVTAIAPPAQVVTPLQPGDPALLRALDAGKPLFDPGLYPAQTAAIGVAAVSLLGFAGVGALAGLNSAGQSKTSRAKLAAVVTKKLKALNIDEPGAGDRSRTWRFPGTTHTDAWIANTPKKAGKVSALMPRLLVDGAWSRAMFGALGFVWWPIGLILGVIAAASVGFAPLPPALWLVCAIIVLGILDATAGVIAWLVITVGSLVTGQVTDWGDFRTLLGLFVLYATLPLLAHVIRPLRRMIATDAMDRFDRVCDYIMMPFFVAFAAAAMWKALNGLSGLELTSPDDLWTIRIVVIAACWLRLAMEDVAAYAYPQRSKAVQPDKLVSPGKPMTFVSIVLRLAVFVIIAAPFFGLGPITWLAALGLGIPMVLKVWEDDLPNSAFINRWFPRGLANFALLLVIGIYLSAWLLIQSNPDQPVREWYTLLLIPGILFATIELFGREGFSWPDTWKKRIAGGVIWVFAASVTAGLIVIV